MPQEASSSSRPHRPGRGNSRETSDRHVLVLNGRLVCNSRHGIETANHAGQASEMVKKLLMLMGALVVVVAVVMALAIKNRGSIVERAVEQVGTDVTGTSVTLGSVETDLKEGRATLRNLVMANPPGGIDETMPGRAKTPRPSPNLR